MGLDRFKALAAAYGGRPARWPEAERTAAQALMARAPDDCAAALAEEAELDGALDGWDAPAPTAALRAAILAGAPVKGSRRWVSLRWQGWLPGAGLAAIGMAGVLCGATLFGVAAADVRTEATVAAATADDPSGWSTLLGGGLT
ncbi:MAG: hypothetical protein ABIO37_04610 [Caulobacteraceae bacterium]